MLYFKLFVLFSVTQRTKREGQHSRNKKCHWRSVNSVTCKTWLGIKVYAGKLFDFELFVNSLQTNNTIRNENVFTSTYNVVFEGQVIRKRDEILCHIYC